LIARDRDVFSLIQGYRFSLLALSRKALASGEIQRIADELAALRESSGIELETHLVAHSLIGRDPRIIRAESNQVFQAYGMTAETTQALYFIRPDGHIAYRSDRLDFEPLKRFIVELYTGGASG
jgi:hypothetical protein